MIIFEHNDFDYLTFKLLVPEVEWNKSMLVFTDDFGKQYKLGFNTEITYYKDVVCWSFIFRVFGVGFRFDRQSGY